MAILIDGYNLLHVTGIFGTPGNPRAFQQSRERMLDFLATALGPTGCSQTTVVFDAAMAPVGLPRRVQVRGIQVYYASDHDSADQLLEELIQQDTSPRQLVVVSSDNRVQAAARRRRAIGIKSDAWYGQLCRDFRTTESSLPEDKPEGPLNSQQVASWLKAFGSAGDLADDDSQAIFPPDFGLDEDSNR